MRGKISIICLGILLLIIPFVIGQVMTPQQINEHASVSFATSSIPVAATLSPGCHNEEVCPPCTVGKACVCRSQIVCSRPTPVIGVSTR